VRGRRARGFPWPDLILSAVLRLGIGGVRDVVAVTATEGGVLSAQRAGARLIVGVLSDMDDASRLRRAGAPTCCRHRGASRPGGLAGRRHDE
jgi:Predicted phosphatase/phosphohexomutase